MTIGSILLAASAVLVLLGVGQRMLDKMRLSDRAALILIAAMFVGGLIPDVRLGLVRINIGGALIRWACACTCWYRRTRRPSACGAFWAR